MTPRQAISKIKEIYDEFERSLLELRRQRDALVRQVTGDLEKQEEEKLLSKINEI